MFGNAIRIELDGFGVTLRAHKKSEMEKMSEYFSSMLIQRYTMQTNAMTLEDESEWWERVRKEKDSNLWAIVPDGADGSIGSTGLHGIHPYWGCCTSGIIIADPKYWGKGIAYRAHLARTWFAVNMLNRTTIQSSVRVPNAASMKALLKVGYRISGKHDRNAFRDNIYMDTYIMSWVNPNRVDLLYPEGVPPELESSLKKAKAALEIAEQVCKFI